jgi:hypothetical protein
MRKVTDVNVLQAYCLELTFDDGTSGTVDLSYLVGVMGPTGRIAQRAGGGGGSE